MAIQKEIWLSDLKEVLTQGADFLNTFTDYSEFADNKYIHIPQAGASATITVNPTSFPLTAAARVDTLKDIQVDLYATAPTSIPGDEEFQLSYAKRNSVMGAQFRAIAQRVGTQALTNILPPAGAKRIQQAGAKIAYADLVALSLAMDLDLVPQEDRYLALPSDMYAALLTDPDVSRALNNGFNYSVVGTAKLPEVAGFKLWKRATVATVNAKSAAIAYHKDSVCFAKSDMKMFVNSGENGEGDALFLGPVLTGAVWFGAGQTRADGAGVVALIQAA